MSQKKWGYQLNQEIELQRRRKGELETEISDIEVEYRKLDDERERVIMQEKLHGKHKELTVVSAKLNENLLRKAIYDKTWWHEVLLFIFILAGGLLIALFGK